MKNGIGKQFLPFWDGSFSKMEKYTPSPEYEKYLLRLLENGEKKRLKKEMDTLCGIRTTIETDIAFSRGHPSWKKDMLYEQCDEVNAQIELVRKLLWALEKNEGSSYPMKKQDSGS